MKKIKFCALFLALSLTLVSCGEESSSNSFEPSNSPSASEATPSETPSSEVPSTSEEIKPTLIETEEDLQTKYDEMEKFKADAYNNLKLPNKYTYIANMEDDDEKINETISMDLENLRANHFINVSMATWDGGWINQSLEYYLSYDETNSILKCDLISEYNNLFMYDEVSMTKEEARAYFVSEHNSPLASYHDTSYYKLIGNPYTSAYGMMMMKADGGPTVSSESIKITSYSNVISTFGEGSLNIDASYVATEELIEDATTPQVPERTMDYDLVIKDGYVSSLNYKNSNLVHEVDGTEYTVSRIENKSVNYEYKNYTYTRSATAAKNNILYGYDSFYDLARGFIEMANF